VFLALSDRDQAQKWAREACNVFEARTVSDPDNVVSRIIWIRALLALDRHHEAQQALRAGLARNPADPNLLQMAREVYAVWAVSLRFDVEERYRLLEEGLKYVPDGGLLLLNLVDAAEESGPVGDSARALIQRLEADPRCAPGVYLSRGIRAFREDPDDVDTAIGHLEKAFQLAPDSPDIANNLAMLLLKRPSPDLPRALDTVNIALKALPNEPTYRDTRGHIYVRQGRWQEAVDDLDFAIPHLKVAADRRETHRALAEAHRQLNHPGQAAHHERLAQAIK
jgi:tetratricopeptide (TPR) repeat protein